MCPFRGQLGPRLIQCGLGRDLLPYQVASSSIQPFGHNRHGQKMGRGGCAHFSAGAESPSNTKSPGPRPTSVPSGILFYETVWPQYTHGQTGQPSRSIEWTVTGNGRRKIAQHLAKLQASREWHIFDTWWPWHGMFPSSSTDETVK